ncbi:MAG: hypothetical protein ACKOZT_05585 [Cyanobium sp.]
METSVAAVQDRWEYLVIHLNVEPGPQAPPATPAKSGESGAASDGAPKPVFSESFLKKEFPHFYEERPAEAPAAKPQHPAQQLQAFLNGQGVHGWELVGLFPVGALSMLFFRRRLPRPDEASQKGAVPSPCTAAGGPGPVPAKAETSSPADSHLEPLLARLSALEARLPAADRSANDPAADLHETAGRAGRSRAWPEPIPADSLDGRVLSAEQLSSLTSEPAHPSQAAARALGLRSAASLANHGARHGYRPGLCKQGPNGMVAVYRGSGTSERGGNAPRLWIVVNRDRLIG